jgi:formamidopyrimidine-DNA glycosylase
MPELPDIEAYLSALDQRVLGEIVRSVRLGNPFVLRTVEPPIESFAGRRVREWRRLGKRLAMRVEGELWLVVHLMIAGRLHWKPQGVKLSGKNALAAVDFDKGSLLLTEAGSKRRASIHACWGDAVLLHDPGGIDVFMVDRDTFVERLRSGNHTLKRSLTDPKLFSGIGNAYSDEILHRARLSPIALTLKLSNEECDRLWQGTRETLTHWRDRLVAEAREQFPEGVTAFRPEMAVHGRFGLPCPECGTTVQRIRYADNETNYCPRCQTGGKILADRSLSRLLRDDWPRSIDELE